MMLMQHVDLIKSEATLAFRRMERLAPTGRDDCEFEEAMWQLEKGERFCSRDVCRLRRFRI